MAAELSVATHYGLGDLPRRFLDAATAAGLDLQRLSPADLAAADEFHTGGRQATRDLFAQLELTPDQRLLDVGSGPGGTSRFLAAEYGCPVTGVDLTPEYVQLATELAARMHLATGVSYQLADATDLPFPAGSFDGAYLLHVGMNVADKARLCAEVARVLTPGAFFAVYDLMRIGDGDVTYPVPWAHDSAISFLRTPEYYRSCLEAAGFIVDPPRERRGFALEFWRGRRQRIAASGPSPLGLHLLMGPDVSQKVTNLIDAVQRAVLAPVEIIARLPR